MAYQILKDELSGLPESVQTVALQQIEEAIRIIVARYTQSRHDYSINNFTKEELVAMLGAPLAFAARLKVRIPE